MSQKKILIYCFILAIQPVTNSQIHSSTSLPELEQNWFVSVNYGFQMSGIKSEDFVSSNYSPLFNITTGIWLSPTFAVQVGYKGFYFNYIGDDIKHHYNFFYGEGVINLNNLIDPERIDKSWELLIHSGGGYFYNFIYDKPNFCINIGIQNNISLSNQFKATIDLASIIGWDIYQGDTDILPGITLGLIYILYSKN